MTSILKIRNAALLLMITVACMMPILERAMHTDIAAPVLSAYEQNVQYLKNTEGEEHTTAALLMVSKIILAGKKSHKDFIANYVMSVDLLHVVSKKEDEQIASLAADNASFESVWDEKVDLAADNPVSGT